jgi:signal transduction histidine kinase
MQRDSESLSFTDAGFVHSGAAMVVLDETATIVTANPAFSALVASGTHPPATLDALLLHDDRTKLHAAISDLLAGATSRGIDLDLQTPAGRRSMRGVITRFPVADHQRWLLTLLDVSDMVRTERERAREASHAMQQNRAKDEFLAVLSHELRTPLNPVVLTLQALRDDPRLDPALVEDVEMIRRNVELEARLIDDLLDITRISRNALRLRLETVDVSATVRDIAAMCGRDARAGKVRMEVETPAVRHHARVDSARLQQVIWNLLRNAIKFTPPGGEVRVSVLNPSPGKVEIRIVDTGIGIAPDVLPRIFNAFEQGKRSVVKRFGGLGLGLAISKALVDAHKGVLRAQSPGPGKGATFAVELDTAPPVSARGQAPKAPLARSGDREPLRILVVDDHEDSLRALMRHLSRRSMEPHGARTVAEAVEIAGKESFHLLLSDIDLPDGTGMDLLKQVHAKQNIPAIALSGFGTAEDVKRSREAGFVMHLTKPIGVDRVLEAISVVLKRNC